MNNLGSPHCRELRKELDRCLDNSILSIKLFAKFKEECIQISTGKSDSRKCVSKIFTNQDTIKIT
jgi:hypothetical protein